MAKHPRGCCDSARLNCRAFNELFGRQSVLGPKSRGRVGWCCRRRSNRSPGSSTFALILTARHDRYKRDLEERANSLHLLSALLDEIEHLRSSVNEALQKVSHLVETAVLKDIPTDRLKTDFLQAARLRIATISSSSGVFAGVTSALHDVEHCNGMLDRYENECTKVGSTNYTMQQLTGLGIADDTKSVSNLPPLRCKPLQQL